jgi:polyisoprenoid-binding protein YceI
MSADRKLASTSQGHIMSESTAGAWVIDPAGSAAEFTGKAYWGLETVRGKFGAVSGAGTVGEDGSVSGQLVIDAASLDTKNKKRDTHLRSADFFNVEKYPSVTVTVNSAVLDGSNLACTGTMEAAGKSVPVSFTASVESATADAVVLKAALPMPRSTFGMTWQQLPGMVKDAAQGSVTARFVRP